MSQDLHLVFADVVFVKITYHCGFSRAAEEDTSE